MFSTVIAHIDGFKPFILYMVVFTSKTHPLHLTSCSNIFGDLIYKSSEKLISILSDMMEIFNSIEFQCYNIHLPMEQAINRIIACDTSTFKRNDAYVVLYCVCVYGQHYNSNYTSWRMGNGTNSSK